MQRHPTKSSAPEIGPSSAGATHFDGPISVAERISTDKRDFVRVGRSYEQDYLHGILSFNEYGLLMLLWLRANPHNGIASVSYTLWAEESRGQFSKNKINKFFLILRSKRYIWFKKLPGRRGPMRVFINHYPLSTGAFMDLSDVFERSLDPIIPEEEEREQEVGQEARSILPPEVITEVSLDLQRSQQANKALLKVFASRGETSNGRGLYTDKEIEKYNDNKTSLPLSEKPKYDPTRPSPTSAEEERARQIADELGEADYRYITSRLVSFDIDVIEHAYHVAEEQRRKGDVHNIGALFNSLVDKFGEEKYGRATQEKL